MRIKVITDTDPNKFEKLVNKFLANHNSILNTNSILRISTKFFVNSVDFDRRDQVHRFESGGEYYRKNLYTAIFFGDFD